MPARQHARSTRHGNDSEANPLAVLVRGKAGRGTRCRRGGVALEFAFALPVLLLFIFGVFEIGRAFWTQTTLEYAVEEAARFAIVNDAILDDAELTTAIEKFARNRLAGLSTTDPPLSFNISYTFEAVTNKRNFVSIQGTYKFAFVTAYFGFEPIDLTANTRMSFVR